MITQAKGTKFKISDKVVGSLKSIGGVSKSASTIDVTTLDSPDAYGEFLGGKKDGGDISLSGFFNYSDDGQKQLDTAFESGEAVQCAIEFPTAAGCKWTFMGVVTAYETGAELEDAISFSATIKVSGKPQLVSLDGE